MSHAASQITPVGFPLESRSKAPPLGSGVFAVIALLSKTRVFTAPPCPLAFMT